MPRLVRALIGLACAAGIAACSAGKGAPDFSLRDDRGQTWTLSQQHGSAVILSFGFTHCRDTCPATLAKLSHASSSLRGHSRPVEIVFVTVDPARDDVATLHRFVSRFSPPSGGSIIGLTGTRAQIARVQSAYGVWSQPLRNGDIAHTAAIVFIDASGRLADVQNDDATDESLARSLAALARS